MVTVLENKREAIASLCARYGVAPRDPYQLAEDYFDMLDELRGLLGDEVDLVMVGAVKNPYIAADIDRTKQLLYAA